MLTGKTCPICLDDWTTMGAHRICSLKCGHLFGHSCLIRWFSMNSKRSCPTCKEKAHTHDIRHIYAKRLVAIDTSELEAVRKDLLLAKIEKNKFQMELTKSTCRERHMAQQVTDLKLRIGILESQLYCK